MFGPSKKDAKLINDSLRIFGYLTATISAASLIQKVFNVSLMEILEPGNPSKNNVTRICGAMSNSFNKCKQSCDNSNIILCKKQEEATRLILFSSGVMLKGHELTTMDNV